MKRIICSLGHCSYFWAAFVVVVSGCSIIQPDVELNLPQKKIYYKSNGISLTGGKPIGGRYSGDGVKDGKFYPQKTTNHKKQSQYDVDITYSYCMRSASQKIRVFGWQPTDEDPGSCPTCDGARKIICPKCKSVREKIQWTNCPKCNGNGNIRQKCHNCKNGKIKDWKRLWFGEKDCPNCAGRSYKEIECPECHGVKRFPCCPGGKGQIECPNCSLNN